MVVDTKGWFLVAEGVRRGPMNLEELVAKLCAFETPSGVRVWHQDLPGWTPAGEIPEVAGQLPPPIPPELPAAVRPELPPPPTAAARGPAGVPTGRLEHGGLDHSTVAPGQSSQDPGPDHRSSSRAGGPRREQEFGLTADRQPHWVKWRRVIAVVFVVVGAIVASQVAEGSGLQGPLLDLLHGLLFGAVLLPGLLIYRGRRAKAGGAGAGRSRTTAVEPNQPSIVADGKPQEVNGAGLQDARDEPRSPDPVGEDVKATPATGVTGPQQSTRRPETDTDATEGFKTISTAVLCIAIAIMAIVIAFLARTNRSAETVPPADTRESGVVLPTPLPTASDTPAMQDLRSRARGGDAVAQNNIGWAYQHGEGVERNLTEGVRWYRIAADQGLAAAQNSLGYCYSRGDGVELDLVEAIRFYRLAADQGDAAAQYNLAARYADGKGVAEDSKEAARWYRKASAQGLADAEHRLGLAYWNGEGVPKSENEARRWLRKAADQGHADALAFLRTNPTVAERALQAGAADQFKH